MAEPEKATTGKRVADRSPRYPFIPLSDAVERARDFFRGEGKNSAKPEIAVTHWGYSAKSSGGRQTLAALRAFGLLENAGENVKLSDRALKIVLDQRDPSPDRIALLKQAALTPPAHKKLWDRFKADLPSDANLRYTLMVDFGFAEGAVEGLVREYRATLAYAGLNDSVTIGQPAEANSSAPPPADAPIGLGDAVDWESQGVLQNAQPLQVKGFSDDGTFAFVEGSGTGLPVSQLSRVEGAERTLPMPQPIAPPQAAGATPAPASGFKQDIFSLDEGQAVLRWPETLSLESYRDFESWLKLVLRKVSRSVPGGVPAEPRKEE